MSFPAARITDMTAHGGVITTGYPTVHIGKLPAARITDIHTCPMVTVLVPHVGGPIITGAWNVLTGNMPQARITDKLICVGPIDLIVTGEYTVLVGTAGGGGGLGGLLGALASCVVALLSPPYPRAVIMPDGSVATEFSKNVFITGTAQEQAAILPHMHAIQKTPSGAAMLEAIGDSGKTVTIKTTSGGNKCTYLKTARTQGTPSDSTVHFNPNKTTTGTGTQPWETRPPGVGLAHELVHATHAAEGDIDKSPVANDSKPDPSDPTKTATEEQEEVRTVGISPYEDEPYSENKIRSEWDPPQPAREWY